MNEHDETQAIIGHAVRMADRRVADRRKVDQVGDCVPLWAGGTLGESEGLLPSLPYHPLRNNVPTVILGARH